MSVFIGVLTTVLIVQRTHGLNGDQSTNDTSVRDQIHQRKLREMEDSFREKQRATVKKYEARFKSMQDTKRSQQSQTQVSGKSEGAGTYVTVTGGSTTFNFY
jgi:hypothetical protein